MSIEVGEPRFTSTPLELAEHLNPEYSLAAMGRDVVRRTAKGRLRSCWQHIEHCLNHSSGASTFEREENFDCAMALTQKIIAKKEAHIDTQLEALVVASYIPVFKKRAYSEVITPDDCIDIYASLVEAFAYLRPLTHGIIPSSLALETFILAASARTRRPDYLLYPASPREESSTVRAINHDSYFVKDGTKLPVQQKLIATGEMYDRPITMLTLLPILKKASHRSGYTIDDTDADLINHTIALVVAEASGEELEKHEKMMLNIVSESVVAHYRESAAYLDVSLAA